MLALLILLMLALIIQRVFSTLAAPLWRDQNFYVSLATFALLGLLYALSRTRHYGLSAALTVSLLSGVISAVAIPNSEWEEIYLLDYLVLSLFFSSILLSWHATVLLAAAHLMGLLFLPILVTFPGLTATRVYIGPLSFNLVISGLILLVTRHRDQLEKDRQAILWAKGEEVRVMSQQLWQAARLATLGELAANIAHEQNNPLATVSLRVESLLAQVPASDPRRRALEVIDREVMRMSKLVADLLDFSRREQPQMSSLNLCTELAQTLELMQAYLRDRHIRVLAEFVPDPPLVRADRQRLRQVFLNLLTNASDAMPHGGQLTLRVSANVVPGPGTVVIEIADTGVGILPEALPKIWAPFYTTKPEGKGTGLGLAICRRIVEEHGGTITITSEPGRGTIVHLRFPVISS